MARVGDVNQKLVDHLVETGCQYVAMGIECGNEKFRRKHPNCHMSNQQIEEAFSLIKNANIFVTSFKKPHAGSEYKIPVRTKIIIDNRFGKCSILERSEFEHRRIEKFINSIN